MENKKQTGNIGEDLAINYLKNNGYVIDKRNFYCRYGELDIIADLDNTLIFIEVKTRKSLRYGYPIESINKIKVKHIINSAKYYMYINQIYNKKIRFDIIEVYLGQSKCKINHIKDILN